MGMSWEKQGGCGVEEVQGKKNRHLIFHDRKALNTYKHAIEKKALEPAGKQPSPGKLVKE